MPEKDLRRVVRDVNMATTGVASRPADLILGRWERLPRWPFSVGVLGIVGIGYFFAFFDIVNIGIVLPAIMKAWHLTTPPAVVISVGLLGYVVALAISVISDRYGRRPALLLTGTLIGIGSLLTGVANSVALLAVGRFIVGMGTGSAISQVTVYIGELAPAKLRGRLTAVANIFAFAGVALTPFIGLAIVPHWALGWRVMLVIPVLGAVVMWLGSRQIVETPRWLALHGRLEEAEAIVAHAEQRLSQLGVSLPPAEPVALPERSAVSWRLLIERRYFPYLALFFVAWFVFYIFNYTYLGLGTTLFVHQGYTIATSIMFVAIGSLGYGLAPWVCMVLNDRFERKHLAVFWGILCGVALAVMGIAPSPATLIIFGFLADLANVAFTVTSYTLNAEHFPTAVRTTAMALGEGLGHFGGAVGPILSLSILHGAGFSGVFLFIGAMVAIAGVLLAGARKTTGQALG